MNLNQTQPGMMPQAESDFRAVGRAQGILGGAGAGESYANQATQPETELQYAARVTTESQAMLEKSIHELANRLQAVLTQDVPSPVTGADKAGRSVTSPIASALLAYAQQTDNITGIVRNLLRRLVL